MDNVTLQTKIRDRITKEHEMWIERYNSAHTNIKYFTGEIVYLKRAPEHTGQPTKLQPKFRGSLVITQVLSGDSYKL